MKDLIINILVNFLAPEIFPSDDRGYFIISEPSDFNPDVYVCCDDDFPLFGFHPVYKFYWFDSDSNRIGVTVSDESACVVAPENAAFVQLWVWGYLNDEPKTLLRYFRKVRLK